MWNKATEAVLPPTDHSGFSETVFCFIDDMPAVGNFYHYSDRVWFSFVSPSINKTLFDYSEFDRIKWMKADNNISNNKKTTQWKMKS